MSPPKYKIHYFGNPILRRKAKEVEKITPEVQKICRGMVDMMVSLGHCIGFAGPQLGIELRIFVIREQVFQDDNQLHMKDPEVIINPTLSSPSEEQEMMLEGCMSFPGLHVLVTRPKSIHVRYQNLKGEWVEEALEGFRARMFMHENDHLNGVLHIDRMDPKERKKIEPTLREIKKKYAKK